MNNYQRKKIELLAPAGSFEKLEIAIHYGADAIYLAGKEFSLRNFSENFTIQEMDDAVKLARHFGVKVYVACNIYPRTFEESVITAYLKQIGEIRPDAVIIADPGILMTAKHFIPDIPIHLSTQANTTSRQSALFWASQGVKRINSARELNLEEIKALADNSSMEIEAFVHGAMCISYSGRCLLSSFMARRDSNRGMCAHPCRWKYSVVEELRPGHYMPLSEDDRGSYIFNSRDLCMIDHIPEMIGAGIAALKIEGRMKGINYLAAAVKTYRHAIDSYYASPDAYAVSDEWRKELSGINQRGYCTGFYLNDPDESLPNYEKDKPGNNPQFVGKVIKSVDENHIFIGVRNKIQTGDIVNVLNARGPALENRVTGIISENKESLAAAQPNSRATIETKLRVECEPNDIIRKI